MIIIGRGEQPQWVWVSAAHAESVRARLARAGLPLIGAALGVGVALVVVGLALPTADSPINVIGVMIAGIGAFWALLSGLSLATARSCAQGEFVDVNGARLVRRLLAVWWGGAIFCGMLAGFAEVMSPLPFTAGSAVYLALLAAVVVLCGIAFFAAGNILGRFRV
ncbi:hypothetical protein SK803_32950 [Lentzea sp. BCCO 10_0856]|uniref:SdpI/YhfL protein family protein n=1 Tax=Lentzea miocenica TaxID=3095431 RepID=A0ABU4TAB9_9PSEU|nr:hypothetical protein [Lentzea sp. BCCO 10_0856]MDX8035050.1 hypothetical protein [Lentzea sp. BCCO 10_0856]